MIAAMVEHKPVLAQKAVEYLQVRPGGVYVDCTVGGGGHSELILKGLSGRGKLITLDRDAESLSLARQRLGESSLVEFHHENFKNLPLLLRHRRVGRIDGCLVDLGVSAHQLLDPERGFSFQQEGPLDMRMDRRQRISAEQLVNELPEPRLAELFRRYGEEPQAARIAAAIVRRRAQAKLGTTRELAELVAQVKGGRRGRPLHPATRVFQALRIAVNQELEGLEQFFSEVITVLGPEGRLVVISFHSLEDRIAKTVFKQEAGKCVCFRPAHLCRCPRLQRVRILTPKPVRPSFQELEDNPRARSAKLRAVERLGGDS